MSWRGRLWSLHRQAGLACAAVFLAVAASGAALLLDPFANLRGAAALAAPPASYAGLDAALASASARHPGHRPGMILPGASEQRAWRLSMRPATAGLAPITVDFDPQSGALLSTSGGSNARDWLLKLHNSLFLGLPGALLILAMSLGLLWLGLSGWLILRRRREVLRRSPLAGPVRARSLHRWAGLLGAGFLVVWATSGAMLLAYKTLPDLVSPRDGRHPQARRPPSPQRERQALAPLVDAALHLRPGAEVQAIMPGPRGASVFLLDRRAAPWAKSSTISFDEVGKARPPQPTPMLMKVMMAAKALHTGAWEVRWISALYLVAALLPLILVITGPWLWLSRRLARS